MSVDPDHPAKGLRGRQVAVLLLLGALCWAGAVGMIRFGGGVHLFDGTWMTAVTFLVTLLGSYAVVWACLWAARLDEADALVAGALVSAAALMLHGVTLTWAPDLYGHDPDVVRLGSAWLLWGVGAALGMAWLRTRGARGEKA